MPPANLQTTKLTPTYREVVSLSFGVQSKKTVIDWSLSVGSGMTNGIHLLKQVHM